MAAAAPTGATGLEPAGLPGEIKSDEPDARTLTGVVGGAVALFAAAFAFVLCFLLYPAWPGRSSARRPTGLDAALAVAALVALVLGPVGEILRGTVSTQYPGAHMLIHGIVFVAVILLMPRGIVGVFRRPNRRAGSPADRTRIAPVEPA
ncbi:MAG: hypothetical protein A2X52_21195 [Candidatus Rokubacteria bacterium GWC2_70_16]|nr:MAG: hypothetical protein A2X52_21195 [Candidatus Rokubacteria bacterium GWC2_70_16]OGL15510.1 MAG: hypothetical protein A3K12_08340 [Candidatus Rokubacteria bacterium RIFCSPLOWO2_12_FULL_71_19]